MLMFCGLNNMIDNNKLTKITTIKVHLVVSFLGFVYLDSIINNSKIIKLIIMIMIIFFEII